MLLTDLDHLELRRTPRRKSGRTLAVVVAAILFGFLLFNGWYWRYDNAAGYDHRLFVFYLAAFLGLIFVTRCWRRLDLKYLSIKSAVFFGAACSLGVIVSDDWRNSFSFLLLWGGYLSMSLFLPSLVRSTAAIVAVLKVQSIACCVFAVLVVMNYLVSSGDGYTFRERFHLSINDTAIIFGLCFAFQLATWVRSRGIGWLNAISCLAIVGSIIVSGSRSSIIVVGIIAVVVFFELRRHIGRLAIPIACIAILGAFVVSSREEYLTERFAGLMDVRKEARIQGRLNIYMLYAELAEEVWTTGIGLGRWQQISNYVNVDTLWGNADARSCHSLYLRLLIEGGVLLVASFLFYIWHCRVRLTKYEKWMLAKRDPALHDVVVAMNAYLLAMVVNGLVSESLFRWYFWFNLGLGLACRPLVAWKVSQAKREFMLSSPATASSPVAQCDRLVA